MTATPTAPAATKTEAWRHQREAVAFVAGKRGALLAMHMGTGKSYCVVATVDREEPELVLIVAPKSVVPNWPRELDKHAVRPFVCVALTKGTVAERLAEAKRRYAEARTRGVSCIVVINHEACWRPPFAEWAMTVGIKMLVVDESHRAKAPGGKLSRFLATLARRVPRRLALSGTPMAHSPLDVYGQYRFLDPSIFGTSFTRFRARYAVMGGYEGHQVIGYQNEAELRRKYRSIAFEASADVLDLPDAIHERREFDLPPHAAKIYKELERDFFADVENGSVTASNALTRLLRLQQLTGGSLKNDDGEVFDVHEDKAALLADLLEDLPPREPVVVFARFHTDLDRIKRASTMAGRSYGELSGRRNDLSEWQAGTGDVLGVQIQAGGVGVDLTRARVCAYFSLSFSLAEWLQSLARVNRPGQTRSVLYVHLLASGTVDAKVYRALEKRQDVIEAILRGDA